MADKIFISYRRSDASADARSIYQWLRNKFGANQLFIDVDTIQKGRDFRTVLDTNLGECKVLLALIGPNWLNEKNEAGERRIDNVGDFVRMEIAQALTRDIAVVPVLVGGAQMPAAEVLPDDLKALSFRQSANISHESFHHDMLALEQDIRGFVKKQRSFKMAAIASLIPIVGAGVFYFWPFIMPSSTSPVQKPDPFVKGATFESIMAECMRKPKHPDSTAILARFVKKMEGKSYQYGWYREGQENKPEGLLWINVQKIEVIKDELHISYDWQNGKLRLAPVIQRARATRSLVPKDRLLVGIWSQDNSYGCLKVSMRQDGQSGTGRWGVGRRTYDTDSFIRLTPKGPKRVKIRKKPINSRKRGGYIPLP